MLMSVACSQMLAYLLYIVLSFILLVLYDLLWISSCVLDSKGILGFSDIELHTPLDASGIEPCRDYPSEGIIYVVWSCSFVCMELTLLVHRWWELGPTPLDSSVTFTSMLSPSADLLSLLWDQRYHLNRIQSHSGDEPLRLSLWDYIINDLG